eukprot:TRINITY_DN1452_c0_g1_i1.p1 TRINITY_DN1452_c0_g1~~TRINITY_DN1452_c0_g1_i1.p1  ORF type:complete len:152 (+),score=29.22 TRINITY_DN1452_c0_g1_i1:466-921(+)
MCELSLVDSSWVSLSTWEIHQPRFVDFPAVVKTHSTFLKQQFPEEDLLVLYLCGADLALKCRLYNQTALPVVTVGRVPYTTQLLKETAALPLNTKRIFYIAETDVEDVSSTEIRRRAVNKISFSDLMHEDAVVYMLENLAFKWEKGGPSEQ